MRSSSSRKLQVVIGGTALELSWEGSMLALGPSLKFYEPFYSNREADLCLRVHSGPLPSFDGEGGDLLQDAKSNFWQLFDQDGDYVFKIYEPQAPHVLSRFARINRSLTEGQVYVHPKGVYCGFDWTIEDAMNPLVEILLTQRLAREERGVMVHAAGVVDGGEGILFVGPSGAGKTTLANFFHSEKGVTVLSDERVVILKTDRGFEVEGTPWPGIGGLVARGPVPLKAIFLISHGLENRVVEAPPRDLFLRLIEQVFMARWERPLVDAALQFTDSLMKRVPVRGLEFRKDRDIVGFVRERV